MCPLSISNVSPLEKANLNISSGGSLKKHRKLTREDVYEDIVSEHEQILGVIYQAP